MSWLVAYNLIEWSICLVMVPVILRRRNAPATSLAWLSLIFFVPAIGVVVYALVGVPRLGRKRVRDRRAVVAVMRSSQQQTPLEGRLVQPDTDPALGPVIRQAQHLGGMPVLGGNQVELLTEADQTIERLIADIDTAQNHVHLLYYIFAPDQTGRRVTDALVRAAARGVKCRVIADAVGSRQFFGLRHRQGLEALRTGGVEVCRALPASPLRRGLARLDLRNHRKLTVVDGHVAYTGSHNIVNADYGHRRAGSWLDLTGRFTGPVVGQLQTVFLEDWAYETDQEIYDRDCFPPLEAVGVMPAQTVPTGPDERSEAMQRMTLAAIYAAQRDITVTTPYLVPDEPTVVALAMAAGRGVRVNLVVPSRSDHPLVSAAGRAYFEPLLDSGVRIYQHDGGLLHAKTAAVDDAFALLGSSNMDMRSFYLNYEITVLLYGPQVTEHVRSVQRRYLASAQLIDRDRWRRRSHVGRLVDSAAALFSPLL